MSSSSLQLQIPKFTGKNFSQWSIQMKVFFRSQDLWDVVETGFEDPGDDVDQTLQEFSDLRNTRKKDQRALYHIFQAVDEIVFERISTAETAKEAWVTLNTAYKGNEKVKMVRLQALRSQFDLLRMKDSESIEEYFNRVISVVNQMKLNGEAVKDRRVVEKILRSLTRKFESTVVAIEESKDLSEMSVDSLMGSLQSHELRMKQYDDEPIDEVFQTTVSMRGGSRDGRGERGSGRDGRGDYRDQDQGDESHPSADSSRGRGKPDHSNFQCNYCKKFGHIKKNCFKLKNASKSESGMMHEAEEKQESEVLFLTSSVGDEESSNTWYIDSGCSNHMSGRREAFVDLDESIHSEVRTGDNNTLFVAGKGDILVQTKMGEKRICDVLFVPDLKNDLLSVGQLVQRGYQVVFEGGSCSIRDRHRSLVARVQMTPEGIYPLRMFSGSSGVSTRMKGKRHESLVDQKEPVQVAMFYEAKPLV